MSLPSTIPSASSLQTPVAIEASASLQPQRFPALDGVRALAIIVVLMHNFSLLSAPETAMQHVLAAWLDRGWVGVQLFFVLSGFLITGILLDTQRAANYFTSFFSRRILRIFPLYFLTLLVVLVLLPLIGAWHPPTPRDAWLVVFLSNWVQPFHSGEGSLPHFWSLAVEEQFYLVWPFVVYRLGAVRVLTVSLGIGVAALVIRILLLRADVPAEAVYELSVCRMDALAFGAAAAAALRLPAWRQALVGRQARLTLVSAAVLLIGALLSRGYQQYGFAPQTVGYSFLAIAFGLFVLAAACADLSGATGWPAVLRNAVFRRIALYSYAMYVVHVPLKELLGRRLLQAAELENNPSVWLTLGYIGVGMIVTYLIAVASYRYFESYFLRFKRQLAARPH